MSSQSKQSLPEIIEKLYVVLRGREAELDEAIDAEMVKLALERPEGLDERLPEDERQSLRTTLNQIKQGEVTLIERSKSGLRIIRQPIYLAMRALRRVGLAPEAKVRVLEREPKRWLVMDVWELVIQQIIEGCPREFADVHNEFPSENGSMDSRIRHYCQAGNLGERDDSDGVSTMIVELDQRGFGAQLLSLVWAEHESVALAAKLPKPQALCSVGDGTATDAACGEYASADAIEFKHGIKRNRLSDGKKAGEIRTKVAPQGTLDTDGRSVRILYNVEDARNYRSPKHAKQKARQKRRSQPWN